MCVAARQVLLELLHRVAAHASANGMDAGALGEALAPCLAWQPPPPRKARSFQPDRVPTVACFAWTLIWDVMRVFTQMLRTLWIATEEGLH